MRIHPDRLTKVSLEAGFPRAGVVSGYDAASHVVTLSARLTQVLHRVRRYLLAARDAVRLVHRTGPARPARCRR